MDYPEESRDKDIIGKGIEESSGGPGKYHSPIRPRQRSRSEQGRPAELLVERDIDCGAPHLRECRIKTAVSGVLGYIPLIGTTTQSLTVESAYAGAASGDPPTATPDSRDEHNARPWRRASRE